MRAPNPDRPRRAGRRAPPPRAPRAVRPLPLLLLAAALAAAPAACSTRAPGPQGERRDFPVDPDQRVDRGDIYEERTRGVFGDLGFRIGGPRRDGGEESGIGVSAYLWRATLDSLRSLPLRSADPFGGVIQTDWHEPPSTPGERVRVDVRIVSPVLEADGVSASVFRQTRSAGGGWRDSPVDPGTAGRLEEAILKRARELRFAEAGGG